MEDQGKRLLLAVALALGILFLWQIVFPPEKPTDKPRKTDVAAEAERTPESPVGEPIEGAAPEAAPGEEQITRLEFPKFVVELSNRGGKIVSWKLTDPKYARDWTKGELIASRDVGAFATNFYKSPVVIPKNAIWEQVEAPEGQVAYRYESPDLSVTKTYSFRPEDYIVEMTAIVDAKRELSQQLAVSFVGAQDPKAPVGGGMGRVERKLHAACHLNGDLSQLSAQRLRDRGGVERGGHVRYAGFNHPYLFFAVAPRGAGEENLACNVYPVLAVPGGMQVDLVYPPTKLRPDAPPLKRELVAYIGPKHLDALELAGEVAGTTAFEDSVDLGWFEIIARPLLSLLTWFYELTGNWGIAIILLTVLVKLATLYWTTKSMRSMRRMAALAPQMKALQEKHKDDRARLQQEMMAMYKQNGVNPLSGCLPILLQMPIWIALYRMLSSAGELYLAPFIPGWIDDLTETDPYYILPVAVTGMMFLSSKLSPATVDNMQQKILIYGMPLIFGVMSFFFPSGLSIYIFTNSALSLLHTLYMKKFDPIAKVKPAEPAKAAAPAPAKAGERLRDRAKPAKAAAPIDVEAEEREPEQPDEVDDDEVDDEDDAAPAKASPQLPRGQRRTNQPRRKRKRGKH